VPFVS